MSCDCRTVEIRILVTAETYKEAKEEAKKIARSVQRLRRPWVTASNYPSPVDRAGCLVGFCQKP